jgi:hypothetical protein
MKSMKCETHLCTNDLITHSSQICCLQNLIGNTGPQVLSQSSSDLIPNIVQQDLTPGMTPYDLK